MPVTIEQARKELRRRASAELERRSGLRIDGTPKGEGFFGPLKLPNGGIATEFSIGVSFDGKETQIPSLVPTLTEQELNLMLNDIIPNQKEIPSSIIQKAVDHAKLRISEGKSPFKEADIFDQISDEQSLLQDPTGQEALAAGISPQDVQKGVAVGGVRGVPVQPEVEEPEKPTLPARQFRGVIDEFSRAIARGGLNVGSGLLRVAAQIGQESIFDVERINRLADKAREISQKPEFQPGTDGGVKGFIANSVGDAISFMAATIGATLIGGPVAGFGVAFAVEGSNAYEDALDDGATQEQAEIEGFVVGGINAALELLQIERVIKFAKAGKGSIKQIVKAAREKALKRLAKKAGKITKAGLKLSITEGVQEALQETTSVLAPGLTGRELPPISEAVKRIGQAGLGGAVAGPILGGAGAVTGAIVDRQRIPGEPEPTRKIPPISEAIKGMKPIEEAERPAPEAKVAEKPEITAPTEAVKPEIARKPIPEQVVTPETEKAGPLTEAQSLAKELEKSLKLSPERALRVAKKKLILDAKKEKVPTEPDVGGEVKFKKGQKIFVEGAGGSTRGIVRGSKGESVFIAFDEADKVGQAFHEDRIRPIGIEPKREVREVEFAKLPKPLAEGAKNRRREILKARAERGENVPKKLLQEFRGEKFADEILAEPEAKKPTEVKPEARPPEQTTTEKTPKIQTQVAETVETDFTKATSAKQASLAEDRESMGLDEINSPDRRSWEESLKQATKEKIPSKAHRIAEEVNANPRPLSDIETAGVVQRMAELKNEHKAAMDDIGETKDGVEVKTKAAEINRIEAEFDALTRAVNLSGTEKGRALAAQKLTINKDFKLISVLSRAKVAAGKKLSSVQRTIFKGLTGKLAKTEKRVEVLESEVNELQAKSQLKRGSTRFRGMTLQQRNRNIETLAAKATRLLEEGCAN